MSEANGDVSGIEVVTSEKVQDSDFQPAIGKPIIKLIWHEQTKQWSVVFDGKVFPSKMFIASSLKSITEDLEKQMNMEREFAFHQSIQQRMMEQAHAQQLSQQIKMGRN